MNPIPASFNTFHWKQFTEWRPIIDSFMRVHGTTDIIDAIRQHREGFAYVDDVTAFEAFYLSRGGNYEKLLDDLVDLLISTYPFVRMYHSCRPVDTQSYYDAGIRVLDAERANRRFSEQFLNNPRFPKITPAQVQAAVDHMARSFMRHGYAYFDLDDRFLMQHCRQYSDYGSEYVQCLAVFLEDQTGYDLKSELGKSGKATVFEVFMPIERFPHDDRRQLAAKVLYAWAYDIAHNNNDHWHICFTIVIDRTLPPELIAGHYHP
jgi:hypothetical protein